MNEWQLLNVRLQMEELVTQREAMKAENEHRARQGFSVAYSEEAFLDLMSQFSHLIQVLRGA